MWHARALSYSYSATKQESKTFDFLHFAVYIVNDNTLYKVYVIYVNYIQLYFS